MNIKSYVDFINEGSRPFESELRISPTRILKKGFNFSSLSKGHEIINKKTGKTYVVQSVGYDSADIKDKNSSKFIGFTIMSLKDYEPVNPGLYEGSLNEGQFSWIAQDTGNQIGSERENTITVYMYDNSGNKWKETSYDGYGRFGGKDYYELLAQMNGLENADRQDGVDLALGKMKIKGDVLFPALVENPNFNWKRHDFTQEPENDPDQSWYKEPEDDYYDEYNESRVTNEAAIVPSNILDFAKRKGSYATSLVKKAATWAEKAGKRISGGTAIGKDYMTIVLDMKHQGSEIYINLNDETIELFGEEVTDAKSFQKVLNANMSESRVTESHFKVGDKVKMSHGGTGVVVSLDKADGAEDEKYYNVKLPNGDMHKHSPNELTKESNSR